MEKNFYSNLTAALRNASGAAAEPKAEPRPKPKKSASVKPIDLSNMQVKYVVSDAYKAAIRQYMEHEAKRDAKIAAKMKAPGKSIDACCEYIYGVMMRRAAKQVTERKNTGVGMHSNPDEVYGMAMHYYDESDETLKKEKL